MPTSFPGSLIFPPKNACIAARLIWQLVIHSCLIFVIFLISRRDGENNGFLAAVPLLPSPSRVVSLPNSLPFPFRTPATQATSLGAPDFLGQNCFCEFNVFSIEIFKISNLGRYKVYLFLGHHQCNIISSFSLFYGLLSGLGSLLGMFCCLCFASAAPLYYTGDEF